MTDETSKKILELAEQAEDRYLALQLKGQHIAWKNEVGNELEKHLDPSQIFPNACVELPGSAVRRRTAEYRGKKFEAVAWSLGGNCSDQDIEGLEWSINQIVHFKADDVDMTWGFAGEILDRWPANWMVEAK